MPTIKEILDDANTVYKKSLDLRELNAALGRVKQTLDNRYINEQNREIAEFLTIKLNLKICAVEYFCNGYEPDAFAALKNYVETTVASCNPTFVKTIALLKSVLYAAESVNKIACDASALQSRVRDYEGRCVAKDSAECREVAALFAKKISAAEETDIPSAIFTDGATFPDVKKQIIADLSEVRAFAEKSASAFDCQTAETILKTAAEDITSKLTAARYEYYPSIANVDRLARTIVLCTPFSEEAELLAYSLAGGAKVIILQALAFENQPENTVKSVFAELSSRGADCVIYGAAHFRADNRNEFYRAVMRYGKGGRRAYLVADDGTQKVYDAAVAATAGTGGELTSLDVSLYYLSMPDFLPTVEEFKRLGMISDSADDAETVKKIMPFAGFVGLNEGVKAFRSGAEWKKIVCERSEENSSVAVKYMLKLVRQALFIDGGWGNYHEDVVLNKTKKFDYDDIRAVNPDNIRKIMQGNFTLFQKCGMISVYCLLCGGSAEEWPTLPPETKSERLTEASKLVMRALDVGIVPVVEVLDKLSVKGAGGLCCDGGKKIQYLDSSVKNFDWVSKAVCHECFHAFQHKAMTSPWQEWYSAELHVTPGRIEQWRYNYSRYRSIDKGAEVYMIQIFESDARAFEEDCLGKDVNRGQILNLIDLD